MSAIASIEAQIIDGQHDSELDRIDLAIRRRKGRLFRPGTKVRCKGTRNREIDGSTGVVLKVNPKRMTVRLDGDHREFLIPASMLEVVS